MRKRIRVQPLCDTLVREGHLEDPQALLMSNFIGAIDTTNNKAELTAVCQALYFLINDGGHWPVVIVAHRGGGDALRGKRAS